MIGWIVEKTSSPGSRMKWRRLRPVTTARVPERLPQRARRGEAQARARAGGRGRRARQRRKQAPELAAAPSSLGGSTRQLQEDVVECRPSQREVADPNPVAAQLRGGVLDQLQAVARRGQRQPVRSLVRLRVAAADSGQRSLRRAPAERRRRVRPRGAGLRRWSLSSLPVPAAITLPWSMTAIRSASWSASSRYWVVSSSVVPWRRSSRTIAQISIAAARVEAGCRLVEEEHPRRASGGSRRGRAGAACHLSTSAPGDRPASARSNRSSSSPARCSRVLTGEIEEAAEHLQVLAARQHLVDRRELTGQARSARGRAAARRRHRGRGPRPARHPARAASRGSGRASSCRRRSGRAVRRLLPCGTSRSTPASAWVVPKRFGTPSTRIAGEEPPDTNASVTLCEATDT